jgi:DNA-3-methyladenine glycosylase II
MTLTGSSGSTRVPRVLNRATLSHGARALAARDTDLARILRRVGDPPLWGRRPGFPALVRIILEQQVSLQAARTMYRRLHAHLDGVTPVAVHALQITGLRQFGLTRQKAGYCHGLAARVLDGTLNLSAIARGPDESGRSALLDVPGLGAWSVDIYFLMALRRPDVWPWGDLALASALRDVKRLRTLPSGEEQRTFALNWAPWRSVAARILWSHYLTERGSKL